MCQCKADTNNNKKCQGSGCSSSKLNKSCNNDNDCTKTNTTVEGFSPYSPFKVSYFEIDSIYNLSNPEKDNQLSNWINQQDDGPVSKFNSIIQKYGNPQILVNQPGGMCIWNKFDKNDPHIRIELKDEYIAHCAPAKHHDFLYSYVKIYVPPEKLSEIQSISGSVNYDPLKHELFARCSSFAANFATLKTVFKKLDSENTEYSKNINNKDIEDETNIAYVKRKVKENQNKFSKELTWEYYPGAFPNGCP